MNRPAPVEVSYKSMRFLITHNPTNATLSTFIEVSGPRGGVRCASPESVGPGFGVANPSGQNCHSGCRTPRRGAWGVLRSSV